MNWKNIIWLISLLLRQTISLSAQGLWMDSIVQLEREIMLTVDPLQKNNILLQKSALYQRHQQYVETISNLNRIQIYLLDTSQRCSYHYQKAFAYSQTVNFHGALPEVLDLLKMCSPISQEQEVLSLLIFLENENWGAFNEFIAKRMAGQKIIPPLLTPEAPYLQAARTFPGLGLFKLQDTQRGVANVALCTAFLGFTVWNVYTGFYVTALFSGVSPLQRFYQGGIRLTEKRLDSLNGVKIRMAKQSGYRLIQQHYY